MVAQSPPSEKARHPPVISQQRITIPNDCGEKLVGVVHETGSRELVILCHGFQSTKEDRTVVSLIAELTREGISAFHFDFSGNGESEGLFQYGNYRKEADDLRVMVLYLSALKYDICAIVGHSKGGNAVLLYASMYHDVQLIINISGRFALERGIDGRLGKGFMQRIKKDGFIDVKDRTGHHVTLSHMFEQRAFKHVVCFNPQSIIPIGKVEYHVTEESLIERLNTDMHAACLSIDKQCRVLTVHGSADKIVPAEDAYEFAKLIANHKLQIIEGADHNYTAHQVDLASVVLDFIKSNQELPSRIEKRTVFSRL